ALWQRELHDMLAPKIADVVIARELLIGRIGYAFRLSEALSVYPRAGLIFEYRTQKFVETNPAWRP
ncbi:MAG: hypothetical protein ABI551_05175, partial [Polyangiaceae bacterium]